MTTPVRRCLPPPRAPPCPALPAPLPSFAALSTARFPCAPRVRSLEPCEGIETRRPSPLVARLSALGLVEDVDVRVSLLKVVK